MELAPAQMYWLSVAMSLVTAATWGWAYLRLRQRDNDPRGNPETAMLAKKAKARAGLWTCATIGGWVTWYLWQ